MGTMEHGSNENGENGAAREKISDRIRYHMALEGLQSDRDLGRRAGLASSTVSRGFRKHNWSEKSLGKIAAALGVDKAALKYGKSASRASDGVETYKAGGGSHFAQPDDPTSEDTDLPQPQELVAFEVTGDSMAPLLRDGQKALAYRDLEPRDGDLAYIELQDGTATVKRVKKVKEQGLPEFWILQPVNPQHDTETVRRGEIRRACRLWGTAYE